MLDYAGHVKLVDFGFAVKLKNAADEIVGQNCGTAMYEREAEAEAEARERS